MLFGKKKKEEKAKAAAKERERIIAEKASVLNEIKKLEEEKRKLEEQRKPKEPFALPDMEAADLENYAIKLKIEGRKEDAFACIKKAAELGSCRAQYTCGEDSLEKGNFEKAAFWFKKAAEKGHLSAITDLSKMILAGTADMTADFFGLLEEKAKYDNSASCYYLGQMYYYGKGTEKDYPKAYYFIEKSSLLEYYGADTSFLAKAKNQYMFANGTDSIYGFYKKVSHLFAAETGRAFYKEKAVEYMKLSLKGIQSFDADTEIDLGEELYTDAAEADHEGRHEEAFELFRKSANFGYVPAMLACALCCFDGKGTPKNLEAAKLFAISGAKSGDLTCRIFLKKQFDTEI